MGIVDITDRILLSIGIGMCAAFHLFRFSIMTVRPVIEDIKTKILCGELSLTGGIIITSYILVSISPALGAIKNKEQRKSLCHLQLFLLLYVLFTFFYDSWEIKSWQYGCVVLIFCVDLIWCIIGLYQEYVPKFGTHENEKKPQKRRKKQTRILE